MTGRKSVLSSLWTLLLLLALLSSCTIEKRLYMRGYHVERTEMISSKDEGRGMRDELVKGEKPTLVVPKESSVVLPQNDEVLVPPAASEYYPSIPSVTSKKTPAVSEKTAGYKLQTTNFQKGPRTKPQPDDLEIWGIVFLVLGLIIGLLCIPFWEAAVTTAYILLGIGSVLFIAGLVCLFIYDPEACIEACAEVLVKGLMEIILGILCGSL